MQFQTKHKNSRCISHRKEKNTTNHHVHCECCQPLPAPTAPPCPGLQASAQILPQDPWFSCGASLMGLKFVLSFCLQPFSCPISCCLWRNPSLVHPLVCGPCCQLLALLICCEAAPWRVKASHMLQSLLAHPSLDNSPVIAIP